MNSFLDNYYLQKDITHLNHGSFGACPKKVMEDLFQNQVKLERNPMNVLARNVLDLMEVSRKALGEYLNCNPEDVVYFPNPTTAVNMVARNIPLEPGDEILSTNHEYGALDRTWRYICRQKGSIYKKVIIPLPLPSKEEVIEIIKEGITPDTKYIFISHISSPTAIIFPIPEIVQIAKEHQIPIIVDGAHAPSQIDLDLKELDADIYVGACHKWLSAPKGTSFLFANKDMQKFLDPLVISWGYESDFPTSSQFIDYHEWQGTRDISPFLTVPDAIKFQQQNDWNTRRDECRELVKKGLELLLPIAGTENIYSEGGNWHSQMAAIEIKSNKRADAIQKQLLEEFRIEVPLMDWEDKSFLRFSIQAYNDYDDLELLAESLKRVLSE